MQRIRFAFNKVVSGKMLEIDKWDELEDGFTSISLCPCIFINFFC